MSMYQIFAKSGNLIPEALCHTHITKPQRATPVPHLPWEGTVSTRVTAVAHTCTYVHTHTHTRTALHILSVKRPWARVRVCHTHFV